jgi:predicted nucleic acid-binding protein
MVLVVDTHVFGCACLGVGAAARVGADCLHGAHTPLLGAALFAEYEDVLARPALFKNCRLDASEREELLDIFVACCRWTRIYCLWRPNLRDEGDNHLMALAVAGNADCIVTRNLRDLARGELRFASIHVQSPEQFSKESAP